MMQYSAHVESPAAVARRGLRSRSRFPAAGAAAVPGCARSNPPRRCIQENDRKRGYQSAARCIRRAFLAACIQLCTRATAGTCGKSARRARSEYATPAPFSRQEIRQPKYRHLRLLTVGYSLAFSRLSTLHQRDYEGQSRYRFAPRQVKFTCNQEKIRRIWVGTVRLGPCGIHLL